MLNSYKIFKLFSLSLKLRSKPVFFIFLFFTITSLKAQENLVPNGSFEEYYSCPTGNELNNGQFEKAVGWTRPTSNTPDYYNRCNITDVGIPNNFWGYQEAFSGDGYVGLGAITGNFNSNYKEQEYIQTTLKYPLIPCREYNFSMLVSLADKSTHGVGKLGVCFSEDKIGNIMNFFGPLLTKPDVVYQGFTITDTNNWTRIEGTFRANGNEKYLTIGYFDSTSLNDTTFVQSWVVDSWAAYYYIDSVSLIEIGETNSSCIEAFLQLPNVITPNNDGINDFIDFSELLNFVDEIEILNRWGNLVGLLGNENKIWQPNELVDGVYFYRYNYNDKKEIKTKTGFIHLMR